MKFGERAYVFILQYNPHYLLYVRARLMRACVRACVAHACVRAWLVRAWLVRACVRVWLVRAWLVRAWLMRGSCVACACVRLCEIIHMYMNIQISLISHSTVFLYTINSFKCNKCSYNTIRNYDLTRYLKKVHGVYVNTPFKEDNQLQAGLSSQILEEYEKLPRMEQENSEEEENEPRPNS